MTDPRPRPKYGEYAPPPTAAPEHASGAADDSQEAVAPVAPPYSAVSAPPPGEVHQGAAQPSAAQPSSAQPTFANTASDAVAPERKRRLWDVLLTSTLLLFGVVDVINTFGTVANLGPVLREGLAAQGAGTFTSDDIAAEAGGIANTVRVVVLGLTIVFALMQIQRKRIAFWIPIVGAVIAGVTLVVAIFVAVLSDPGFMAYVDSMQ